MMKNQMILFGVIFLLFASILVYKSYDNDDDFVQAYSMVSFSDGTTLELGSNEALTLVNVTGEEIEDIRFGARIRVDNDGNADFNGRVEYKYKIYMSSGEGQTELMDPISFFNLYNYPSYLWSGYLHDDCYYNNFSVEAGTTTYVSLQSFASIYAAGLNRTIVYVDGNKVNGCTLDYLNYGNLLEGYFSSISQDETIIKVYVDVYIYDEDTDALTNISEDNFICKITVSTLGQGVYSLRYG